MLVLYKVRQMDTVFVLKVKDVKTKKNKKMYIPFEQRLFSAGFFPFDWIFAVKTTKVLLSYCTVLRFFLRYSLGCGRSQEHQCAFSVYFWHGFWGEWFYTTSHTPERLKLRTWRSQDVKLKRDRRCGIKGFKIWSFSFLQRRHNIHTLTIFL